MKRLTGAALALGLTIAGSSPIAPRLDPADLAANTTLLDIHPVDPSTLGTDKPIASKMPSIVRPGPSRVPDPRQLPVPQPAAEAGPLEFEVSKAGTGVFVGGDGTLLTAAHVISNCQRIQIISRHVPRTWASFVAADPELDLAILRPPEFRAPAVVRLGAHASASGKLFLLGYPASAPLTVPAETWAEVENDKFPAHIGALASPRELLWLLAPAVEHGYSGGPVFDPRTGTLAGIVKGAVHGGYLRVIRDMPTVGMAIAPGIGQIEGFLRREAPYSAVAPAAAGADGLETVRRATVHVLCWR